MYNILRNGVYLHMKKFLSTLLISLLSILVIGCGESKETKKEITANELTQKLQQGSVPLDYATYTEVTNSKGTYLDVDMAFTNEVLRNGTIKAITNLVDEQFADKYDNIHMTITQEKPNHDFVEYEYNGDWVRKK